MEGPKRVQFTTIETNESEEKKPSPRKTVRFNLDLPATTDTTCPEFSFTELLKNISGEKRSSDDPFGDDDDADRLAAIAKSFEEKYKPKMGKKKRNKEYLEDLVDLGDGYDENDTFIDNSEAYDEIVPVGLTTKLGGFYINSGKLDFKEVSDDSDNDFQPTPGSTVKKKQKKRRISSDDESGQENKKVIKKIKVKDSLAVPGGEVKKKKKKKLLLQDGEKPVVKKSKISQEKDKAKSNKSSTVAALLKSTSPQQNGEGLQNGIPSPIELEDSNDSVPKQAAASSEEREDSNSQADFEDSKKEIDPEKIPKLPPDLSPELETAIESLKNSAKESGGEGKLKFFTGNVNKLLLEIELASLQMTVGNRSSLYGHLAAFLPCSKDTLLKRAKTLRVKEMDDKIKGPLQKLKDAVSKAMPALQEKYESDLKAAQEKAAQEKALEGKSEESKDKEATADKEKEKTGGSDNEEEGKTKDSETTKKKFIGPIKRFVWDDNLKSLLCDVVKVKMESYEVAKTRTQTAEEYLRTFLEKEIRPIWPKGWMQSRILIKESRPAHMKWTSGSKLKKALVSKTPGSAPTLNHVTKTTNQASAPAAVGGLKTVINSSNKNTPQVTDSAKSLVNANSHNTPVVSVKKIVPTILDYANASSAGQSENGRNNANGHLVSAKTDNIISVKPVPTPVSTVAAAKQAEPKAAHSKPLAESWNHQVADILRQSVVNQITNKPATQTQFQRQNSYENSFLAQFQNFTASTYPHNSNKLPSPKETGQGQSPSQPQKPVQQKQAIDLSPLKAHTQSHMTSTQQQKFLQDAQEKNIQRLLQQQLDEQKKIVAAQQLAKMLSQSKSPRNPETSPVSVTLASQKQLGNVSLLTENVIRQQLDKRSSAISSGKASAHSDIFPSPKEFVESLRKTSPQSNTVSSTTSQVKPQIVRVAKVQGQGQGHSHSNPGAGGSMSATNLMQSLFGQAQSKASSLAASYQSGVAHSSPNQPRSLQQSPSGMSSQISHVVSPSWNVGSLSQPGYNGIGESQRRTSFDGSGDGNSQLRAAFQPHPGMPPQPHRSPEAGRYGNQMAPHTSPGSYPTHSSPHKQRSSLNYGYPYSDAR